MAGQGQFLGSLVPIASKTQWDKYVKTIMKNEFRCLDLVVQKLSNDPTPHGYSPPNGNPALSITQPRGGCGRCSIHPNEVGICVDDVVAGP
jgi:hypothetical protein